MQLKLRLDKYNETLKITYRRYRNFCSKIIKKLKRKYDSDLLDKSTKNSKELWKNIKNITNISKTKQDSRNLLKIYSSPIISANSVNSYFASVGKNLAEKCLAGAHIDEGSSDTFYSQTSSFVLLDTSLTEVGNLLMSLNSNSAPGWDNVATHFLKFAKSEVLPIICHLSNLCFCKGVFPSSLKQAIITPVFKSGDDKEVSNYRPISVLPAISKILEKLINTRLMKYLDKFKILSDSQFGFRNGKSTEDAVAALSTVVVDQLDRGKKCLAVFLDLKKAFDTVSVPILIQKLEKIGIRGTPLDLFKDYLTDRKQSVKIGQFISNVTSVSYGVPQGSVLGPTLFLIYINNLCELNLANGNIFAYADDTALVFSGDSWEHAKRVSESGLAIVSKWLKNNLLTLNAEKTKYVCFSIYNNSQPDNTFNLKIHDCINFCNCPTLDKVHSIRYLGVIIDQRLTWHLQIDLVTGRIRKLIWIFKILRHVASLALLTKIYIALAQPILMYCIPVWGGSSKTKFIEVERAQRSLLKVMFFKHYRYPTTLLYSNSHVLTVRKLYILNIILRFHKHFAFDQSLLNRRRKDLAIPSIFKKTAFASNQYDKQAAHVYKQVNKALSIYPMIIRDCKRTVTEWLDKLDYGDVEKLLKYSS